jgi:hypothetical protein
LLHIDCDDGHDQTNYCKNGGYFTGSAQFHRHQG